MRISYGIFLSALLIYLYYRDRTMRQKGCDPGANIFARSATSMKKILKAARAAAYAALLLTFVISAASCTSTAGAVPEFDGGVIKLEYNCDGTTEEITVVLKRPETNLYLSLTAVRSSLYLTEKMRRHSAPRVYCPQKDSLFRVQKKRTGKKLLYSLMEQGMYI